MWSTGHGSGTASCEGVGRGTRHFGPACRARPQRLRANHKQAAGCARRRVQALKDSKMEKPTAEQLAELKRLSAIARVPDESEIVTSMEEAETRIRDLKDKARME